MKSDNTLKEPSEEGCGTFFFENSSRAKPCLLAKWEPRAKQTPPTPLRLFDGQTVFDVLTARQPTFYGRGHQGKEKIVGELFFFLQT